MTSEPTRMVFATHNQGKVKELIALTRHLTLDIVSASQWPGFPDIPETGDTFRENAFLKAVGAAKFTGCPALADDSGLVVDALGGDPGVRSARYSDPGATPERNTRLLLERMRSVPWPERTARFVCVIAFARPGQTEPGKVRFTEGSCEGYILETPKGGGGFGYDPVFYSPRFARTFAELGIEIKNRVSHRARAMAAMADLLESL